MGANVNIELGAHLHEDELGQQLGDPGGDGNAAQQRQVLRQQPNL